jgi:lysozyme family protein
MNGYPDIFLKVIKIVLKNEGGYSNSRTDKGGETNYGISSRAYPAIDIKNLTIGGAIEIYYNDYWRPMNLGGIMDDDLILQVFDMGVNSGIRIAIKLLQRLVGVPDDGFVGNETLGAIKEFNGNILDEFIKRRKLFYVTLVQNHPEQRPNLKGWLNRISNTHF